jgi:SAM-dependent methyltransferase
VTDDCDAATSAGSPAAAGSSATAGSSAASRLWVDRSYLLGSQYKTDTNLAARQSLYSFQRPRHDVGRLVIDLAGLTGTESVADVGCGNGVYLAELARRGHRGPVVGLDLSSGMLAAARDRVHAAGSSAPGLVRGDAAAIPLPDGACDVALAPHMLYHLPDPVAGVRELRRIVRPGGQALVVLNGEDHLRELRDLVDALDGLGWPTAASHERVSLDEGEDLLSASFTTVTRHDFHAWLEIPDPEPVIDYVRSMRVPQNAPAPESVVAAATARITASPNGLFRIRTHSGCLICT